VHSDLCSCHIDFPEFVGGEFECNGSDILFEAPQLGGARDVPPAVWSEFSTLISAKRLLTCHRHAALT
jgi:hypothetical protein